MSAPQRLTRRDLFTRWLRRLDEDLGREGTPRPPRPAREMLPGFLRPPGAAEEKTFLKRCDRCGDCRQACPYDVILPLGPAYGEAEGTPALLPRGGPCRLCPDLPCAAACPTGALTSCAPESVRMGVARIDPALCWAHQGQPCDYCAAECPLGENVLRFEGGRPVLREEACAGCGMCLHICTATPPAIRIEAAHTGSPAPAAGDGSDRFAQTDSPRAARKTATHSSTAPSGTSTMPSPGSPS